MVLILGKRLFLVLKKKERKWRDVRQESKRGTKRTWDT